MALLQEGPDRFRLSADFRGGAKAPEKSVGPVSPRDGADQAGEKQGSGRRIAGGACGGLQLPRAGGCGSLNARPRRGAAGLGGLKYPTWNGISSRPPLIPVKEKSQRYVEVPL